MEKCIKCNFDMILEDKDTFDGILSYWYECPNCGCSKIVEINLRTKAQRQVYYDLSGNKIK